jgi:hypothetical protein
MFGIKLVDRARLRQEGEGGGASGLVDPLRGRSDGTLTAG